MAWQSAELLLFNDDSDGPSAYPFWITPLNTGGRRIPCTEAAVYRHQRSGECNCAGCRAKRAAKAKALKSA
jgi:hypothetical protein